MAVALLRFLLVTIFASSFFVGVSVSVSMSDPNCPIIMFWICVGSCMVSGWVSLASESLLLSSCPSLFLFSNSLIVSCSRKLREKLQKEEKRKLAKQLKEKKGKEKIEETKLEVCFLSIAKLL